MRCLIHLILVILVFAAVGCGRVGLAGEYRAEIRLMEGKQESTARGYSLAEVQARVAQDQRTLTLNSNGRFAFRSGSTLNEGKWRKEGDTLILRDDISNGNRLQPALQKDRRWRVGDNGEIISEGSYSYYNLAEVYTRTK